MLRIIRSEKRQAYLFGTTKLFAGVELPQFVKYHGLWPRLRVIFQYERQEVSKHVSYRAANKQFTASVPAKGLDLPPIVTGDDNAGVCTQINALEFMFDFNNMRDMVAEQQARRRSVLVAKAIKLLHEFGNLRGIFEKEFKSSLEREIGVRIEWDSDDIVTVKPHSWQHHLLILISLYFRNEPFDLTTFYHVCNHQLQALHPDSHHIEAHTRDVLQELCDIGLMERLDLGVYRRTRVQFLTL